jgi:ubiquinone/menaquinone biosynthesis C-methylase UbiE
MENANKSSASKENRVCPWQAIKWFDNFLRPLIHNPLKLFGLYVKPGMTVLDVGCGRGFASLGLAQLVGEDGLVISADIQPEMLEMVRKRAEKAGLSSRIRFHLSKFDGIGVQETPDFVLAFWMLHETPNIREFLKEIFTILKPGGRFFLAEPKAHVSRDNFEVSIHEAQEVGFKVMEKPYVFLSRAVVLVK